MTTAVWEQYDLQENDDIDDNKLSLFVSLHY